MKKFRSTTAYSVARYLAVVAFAMTSLVACKKDGDPSPDGKNGVAGDWKISGLTVSPPQNGVSDYLSVLNALLGNDCITKITFTFKGDGTMGGNVPKECQSTDPSDNLGLDQTSTWKIQGKKIIITDGSDATEYDLDVNKSTMTWATSEIDPDDGKTYTTTFTFKRI